MGRDGVRVVELHGWSRYQVKSRRVLKRDRGERRVDSTADVVEQRATQDVGDELPELFAWIGNRTAIRTVDVSESP
jgi:hypothetical protein